MVYTASISKYANPLLDLLDPDHCIQHRLFRDNCKLTGEGFIKDLSQLGRDLKDIIIIDNSPIAYSLQPLNALPIKTWIDDKEDTELNDLLPILKLLSMSYDVRTYLKLIVNDGKIEFESALEMLKKELEQWKSNISKPKMCLIDHWIAKQGKVSLKIGKQTQSTPKSSQTNGDLKLDIIHKPSTGSVINRQNPARRIRDIMARADAVGHIMLTSEQINFAKGTNDKPAQDQIKVVISKEASRVSKKIYEKDDSIKQNVKNEKYNEIKEQYYSKNNIRNYLSSNVLKKRERLSDLRLTDIIPKERRTNSNQLELTSRKTIKRKAMIKRIDRVNVKNIEARMEYNKILDENADSYMDEKNSLFELSNKYQHEDDIGEKKLQISMTISSSRTIGLFTGNTTGLTNPIYNN